LLSMSADVEIVDETTAMDGDDADESVVGPEADERKRRRRRDGMSIASESPQLVGGLLSMNAVVEAVKETTAIDGHDADESAVSPEEDGRKRSQVRNGGFISHVPLQPPEEGDIRREVDQGLSVEVGSPSLHRPRHEAEEDTKSDSASAVSPTPPAMGDSMSAAPMTPNAVMELMKELERREAAITQREQAVAAREAAQVEAAKHALSAKREMLLQTTPTRVRRSQQFSRISRHTPLSGSDCSDNESVTGSIATETGSEASHDAKLQPKRQTLSSPPTPGLQRNSRISYADARPASSPRCGSGDACNTPMQYRSGDARNSPMQQGQMITLNTATAADVESVRNRESTASSVTSESSILPSPSNCSDSSSDCQVGSYQGQFDC